MPKLLRSLLLLLALAGFTGCGIIDMVYLPPPEDTAEELYEAGTEAMAEKNFVSAVQYFNKLRDAYPFSPYVVDVELALSDAYYLDGEYENALEAYRDFESLHPRHPAIEYVIYQMGQCLQNQFMSIDRPTNVLYEACAYYDRLVDQYPGSPYAEAAIEKKKECRRYMAEHELYIADMFWHMEKPGPAWHRYSYIIRTYPDIEDVSQVAASKSTAAYREYSSQRNEERREAREGTWKDWFRWL